MDRVTQEKIDRFKQATDSLVNLDARLDFYGCSLGGRLSIEFNKSGKRIVAGFLDIGFIKVQSIQEK